MKEPRIKIEQAEDYGYFVYANSPICPVAFCFTLLGAQMKARRILRKLKAGLHTEVVTLADVEEEKA